MKRISGADILKVGEMMADLKRMANSRRVTFDSEKIIGPYRFDAGTYEITRIDAPDESEGTF